MWQSGPIHVVLGSMFGGLAPYFERAWDYTKWAWKTVWRVIRVHPAGRDALLRVLDAVEHPAYQTACVAVRKTATTIGFNRSTAWIELGRAMKRSPGDAENTYRHLESVRLLRGNLLNSTLTNPQAHLMTELAYQDFAVKGR